MGSAAAAEKTEAELRNEIDELYRQQREITARIRDPKGVRRGGPAGSGPRNFAANVGRRRGFVRPADRLGTEEEPPAKRRLSSAVFKVEDGEKGEGVNGRIANVHQADYGNEEETADEKAGDGVKKPLNLSRGDASKMDFEVAPIEHVPRIFPKNEDPSLINRNKRMLGQLLGTLERFKKEDMQRSSTEAYMKRSDSLRRAEQRAREESEKLREQEREQITEKRKRDLILRARIAAKAEEKKLELLFLRWSEHHKRLGNFVRTKAEPSIYYMFTKPLDRQHTSSEDKEKIFQEWKAGRREELSLYQAEITEQYIGNADMELERWQNRRRPRANNDTTANLQETMDKELETHQLEHGPKSSRGIRDQNDDDDDDDDVEDINAGEDDTLGDVMGMDDGLVKEEDGTNEKGL